MNEISDTMELEAAVAVAEFTDELSDEALDRPTAGAGGSCTHTFGPSIQFGGTRR